MTSSSLMAISKDGPSPCSSPLIKTCKMKTVTEGSWTSPLPEWVVALNAHLFRASPPESALPQRHKKRPSCLNLVSRSLLWENELIVPRLYRVHGNRWKVLFRIVCGRTGNLQQNVTVRCRRPYGRNED